MKVIVLALFFISGCVVGVDGALAQCACPHPNITAFEEFKKSEAVFIGEVLGSDIVENPAHKTRGDVYDMEINFKVKKVWRKSLQEKVSVRFLVYGCIRKFDTGSEHLVYAFNDNKRRLRMYCCCTRSRPLVEAAEDVKEFKERGEEPKPIIMNQKSRGVGVPNRAQKPILQIKGFYGLRRGRERGNRVRCSTNGMGATRQ